MGDYKKILVNPTTTTGDAPYSSIAIPTTAGTGGIVGGVSGVGTGDIELHSGVVITGDYEFNNFGELLYAIHGMEARLDSHHREISNLQAEIRNLRNQVTELWDEKTERERDRERDREENSKYSQKELDVLLGGCEIR